MNRRFDRAYARSMGTTGRAERQRGKGALPRTATVRRDELIERLLGRFDARVTTLIGGAGIGKTTVLAQALRLDGDRVDVWYPCTAADRMTGRLVRRLADACADALDDYRPGEDDDAISALVEMVVANAPDHVCLVLDDIHVLDDPEPIDELVNALPANGHLLLSGRRLPPIPTARIDALGGLLKLQQEDLLLSDREVAAFARQRNVDADDLAAGARWPAFVDLASRGGRAAPHAVLAEEVLPSIGDERRVALAAFALIGGGDNTLAQAVTGMSIDTLLDGLPLVRWSGDDATLHDLWAELLADVLTPAQRVTAIEVLAEHRAEHRDFDGAIIALSSLERWARVKQLMRAAMVDGQGRMVGAEPLQRWLDLLPDPDLDEPVCIFAHALIARDRDPIAEATSELFDRAARRAREEADDELELSALLQLGYVGRVGHAVGSFERVIDRLEELAERFAPARTFRAFGRAWAAAAALDKRGQLDALRPIEDVDLPPAWAIGRDHLIANSLQGLGSPRDALAYVADVDQLAMHLPAALTTRAMCLWYAGLPTEAVRSPLPLGESFGTRERALATSWSAVMHAWQGDIATARDRLATATRLSGELPAAVTLIQLAGLDLLLDLVDGDELAAAEKLTNVLERLPLGSGPVEVTLQPLVAVPYVLVPSTQPFWDELDGGPAYRSAQAIARAFVALRTDEGSTLSSVDWSDPAFIAVSLPTVWAIEFGLRSIRHGEETGGRRLIAWLCENWGDPARSALRSWVKDPDIGEHARDVLAHTPVPPAEHTTVALFGGCRLTIDDYPSDLADWRRERVRALLVWLSIHRAGTRERIAGSLWPEVAPDRAARNLRTTLNYLHGVLEPRRSSGDATWFVRVEGSDIALHGSLDVDIWRFSELLERADRHEADGRVSDALPLLVEAVSLYGGDLAPELDQPWLELERIHLRSRYVRASCRAAELLSAKRRPDEAVEIATAVLGIDPYHQPSYAALSEAYDALGDTTSANDVRARAVSQLTNS